MKTITIIDPPAGWKYGFPKHYDKKDDQTLEEWLLEKGYPQVEIDNAGAKYCRFWEHTVDERLDPNNDKN